MGLSLSSLLGSLSSLINWSKDKDVRILMLGLDSAGKVSGTLAMDQTAYRVWGRLRLADNNLVQATGNATSIRMVFSLNLALLRRLAKSFRQYQVSQYLFWLPHDLEMLIQFFSNRLQCGDGSGIFITHRI